MNGSSASPVMRADVEHDDQRDDAEGQQPQDIVDPQGEERDLEHIAAEAADGLAGRIGQGEAPGRRRMWRSRFLRSRVMVFMKKGTCWW
jgi:hypothetical protein